MLAKPKLAILMLSAAIVAYGLVGGLLERVSAEEDDPYGQLSIFTDVLRKIRDDYVDQPNLGEAFNGALQGMMEALDPYSSFVDPAIYAELEEQAASQSSPGLVLSKRYGYMYVVAVEKGSPAEQEGLRTGDLIESIEGVVTSRMSPWEADARLRGATGTVVKLRVVRARRSEPVQITLKRELPHPVEVESRIVDSEVGLLSVGDFHEGVSQEISAKLKLLRASNVKGILIDIRGNAKGVLAEAVQSADLFLSEGMRVVSVRSRDESVVDYVSLAPSLLTDEAVVLLVDGGTSGAAEVFAAALVDNKRATVVGERTNGLGSIQKPFELSNGARLFLSTALYLRPDGSLLQQESLRDSGVTPDVRSPNQEFVTAFYFENTSENLEESLNDEFYRKLERAVEQQQLERGLQLTRDKVFEKAA